MQHRSFRRSLLAGALALAPVAAAGCGDDSVSDTDITVPGDTGGSDTSIGGSDSSIGNTDTTIAGGGTGGPGTDTNGTSSTTG
jgi:hypothetical protein